MPIEKDQHREHAEIIQLLAHVHEMLHYLAEVELANSKKLDALLTSAVNSDKLAELTAELKGSEDKLRAAIAAVPTTTP